MNRRDFLASSAWTAGALVLSLRTHASELVVEKHADGEVPLGDFIRITADGDVIYHFTKHEMGQGVATAMAQILCEELCANWERVRIEFPLVDLPRYENDRYGGYGTGGSCTLFYTYDMLREAGATVRQMLINAAAQRWNTAPAQCYAENHRVLQRSSSQRLSFGELASIAATLPVPTNVALKEAREF